MHILEGPFQLAAVLGPLWLGLYRAPKSLLGALLLRAVQLGALHQLGAITAGFQTAPEHHGAFTFSLSFGTSEEGSLARLFTVQGTDFCWVPRSSLQGQNPNFSQRRA